MKKEDPLSHGAQQPLDAPEEEQTHELTLKDFEEFMRREESMKRHQTKTKADY